MTGNEACAEAAIRAGLAFYTGYPITPQSEIPEYHARELPKRGGVFIPAESELAAINMLFGASSAGKRVMTSSSSPGISLKQEGISYLACAELPVVVVDVVRGGPGLGNIAPSQEDYLQATRGGGHGNYRTIVLAPSTVQEFADLTYLAFDLADKYRNPTLVLADGLLGQMTEPVEFEHLTPITSRPTPDWALTGAKGRTPNLVIPFYLYENELEEKNRRLQDKYQKIREFEARLEFFNPLSKEYLVPDTLVIGYGTVGRILKTVVKRALKDGIRIGLIRPITLWPFPYKEIRKISEKTDNILVVEMSDGQMVEDVKLAVGEPIDVEKKVHFYNRMGGVVPTPEEILEEVKRILAGIPKKERPRIKIETDKEVFSKTLEAESEKFDSPSKKTYTRPKSLTKAPFTYCPGCNHSTTHKIIAEVIDELGIRDKTIGIWPVGCSVMGYRFLNIDSAVAAHGRAPAVATGIKRLEPDKIIYAYQGDGDLACIGTAETIHTANRGENITVIFINNALYGMTGGQMAPTTLVDQIATTCPYGRNPKNEGYPIRVCELLATLPTPYYITRVAMYNPKEIRKAKKAIKKAFQYQIEGKGYTFVEVLSACPTGWKKNPIDALKWVEEKMVPVFPLGVFIDKGAEK